MTDSSFTPPSHLPGMSTWLFEYDGPDGVYGIVLSGSDPQQIINDWCLELPGIRLCGEHGGTVRTGENHD